jgi:hypothetical protein
VPPKYKEVTVKNNSRETYTHQQLKVTGKSPGKEIETVTGGYLN